MSDAHAAIVLTEGDPEDAKLLWELRARPDIEFIDNVGRQRAALQTLTPPPGADLQGEPFRWVYYPWRRCVVAMLGPGAYRRLRLDRNRNLITDAEQDTLAHLRIGVIGLSVGHVIAHTLAAQGICGELRLADFDELEAANLNRVPATVFDEGINKATIAARRIAELDPYLRVQVHRSAITVDTIDAFLDGLDIVVEECDSLDTKALVREAARARRIPVLMTTSDRGLLDVERFDLHPERPILHGLLGNVDTADLSGLSSTDKVPYVLGLLDAKALSARMAASLCEVGETLSTWPQLAGEVVLGAALIAESVRRIGLGEPLASGRTRLDAGAVLDEVSDPLDDRRPPADTGVDDHAADPSFDSALQAMAYAAHRAPSGGNSQPWLIDIREHGLELRVDPHRTSQMDVEFRGSAVALGAAALNAQIAAAAHGHGSRLLIGTGDGSPLQISVILDGHPEPGLAELYEPMLQRATNRHHGAPITFSADLRAALYGAADAHGGRLHLITERAEIQRCAEVLAEADRIRYLTNRLHSEMFAEIWSPGDPSPEYGIDVRTLELPASDLAVLDVLRRSEVMDELARWDAGSALGSNTRDRVGGASAVAVISVAGHTLADYARAGAAVEAVWITAQTAGLAVQPVSPAFLYAHDDHELAQLAPAYPELLGRLQYTLRRLTGTPPEEAQALVLRITEAPRPSLRSRRRPLSYPTSLPATPHREV
ncbi:Rv1355c family protein [Mycolicibacterium bacteremicum]|uniref:Rv1355c family protein n=1 Tax=Mycolicibacterium bacteremicum TaxID=564198 RepID=UPI0026ED529C|nr:Rv1355c family protein [Mycolicibacterium bacteremicum]